MAWVGASISPDAPPCGGREDRGAGRYRAERAPAGLSRPGSRKCSLLLTSERHFAHFCSVDLGIRPFDTRRMSDDIAFLSRLSVAVPDDMASAVRSTAAARGLTGADYIRGALQARLTLDGARFRTLPNLQRLATRPGRDRTA